MELALTCATLPAKRATNLAWSTGSSRMDQSKGGCRAGPGDRCQRAAGRPGHEADRQPITQLAAGRVLRAATTTGEAVRSSEDAREGARAFAEKRVPVWQGR